LKPLILWELGTGYGRTGRIAARNTPDNAKLFTIDFDRTGTFGRIFRDRPEAKKITVFNHDTSNFDFSPWRGKVNLVFGDANHEYEYVLRDTAVAFHLVAPGGWIIWHDVSIDTPGVPAALTHYSRTHLKRIERISGSRYGVCRSAVAYRAKD
jgi:predicted O-methyltransferase YrrM